MKKFMIVSACALVGAFALSAPVGAQRQRSPGDSTGEQAIARDSCGGYRNSAKQFVWDASHYYPINIPQDPLTAEERDAALADVDVSYDECLRGEIAPVDIYTFMLIFVNSMRFGG